MNLYSVLYVLNGLFPLAFLPFSSKVFHIHVEYTYTPQSRFICQLIPTIKIQRIICMIPFFFFPLYSFEALFVVTNPVHHLFQCVFCVCVCCIVSSLPSESSIAWFCIQATMRSRWINIKLCYTVSASTRRSFCMCDIIEYKKVHNCASFSTFFNTCNIHSGRIEYGQHYHDIIN